MTWVYNFGSGNADGRAEMKNLLGGKGANLAEMASIGLPVPPGFTLTTEICTYYYQNDCQYPADLKEQVTNALALVETRTGRKFGDATNPLLVSVRSGARASMPGMMDTVLNLGLNDATAEALAKQSGDRRFAFDSYRRFVQMYSDVVLGIELHNFEKLLERSKKKRGVTQDHELQPKDLEQLVKDYKACVYLQLGEEFPEDPQQQLWGAVGAVFGSWMNQRAKTYRKLHDIPEEWGTAVNVQAMVFGNMGNDCATGVAFTRNPSNGAKDFYGEFLVNAQGEDVVAGIRTPQELTIKARKSHGSDLPSLEEVMPGIFRELENVRHQLENHYRDMQDIEFTIQQGKLYMLQTRTGKRTAHAALQIAVDMANEGLISKSQALMRLKPDLIDQLLHPTLDPKAKKTVIAKGLPASPGAAAGKVVFSADEAVTRSENGDKVILVRIETSPDDIHGLHAAEGVLTTRGGMTSHAAVVARGMGRPCVAGAGEVKVNYSSASFEVGDVVVHEGQLVTIDGVTGEVMLGEVPTVPPQLSGAFGTVMSWADEFRTMQVRANAETPADARQAKEFGCEGIGLVRTEHMFFEGGRIVAMRQMILASDKADRQAALNKLLAMQREDISIHEDAPCAFARLADADYDCGGRGAKFLLVICDSWFDSGQHSQLLGVRIGEAKNPGPSPWGSYVTRRKRKRKSTGQATSVAAGAPGISALFGQGFQQQVMQMMQSMMEAMMGKMMESFFGGGGHWASGATTVGSPAKGKGKHGQMKGPGGGSMGEPPGAASVSEGKGVKGKDADSAKGKPKGKDHGNVKGQDADYVKGKPKGQGKNGGGAGGGKQSSKGAKDDGGPGLTGAASSKGKGKNRGDVDTSAGGEWEVIAWHAKPAAFGCARLITGIEALETALEADEKILVQVPAEDFCEAASIMDGGCHSGSVLIKDGEACGVLDELQKKWPVSRQHVPGTMGGNPRLRRVWVCTFGSAASLAPALDFVKAPAPKRRRNEDTVVLRCTAWRAFAEAKDFQSMLKKPGQTARAWYTKVAPLCIQEFIDSWGWQSFGDDQVKGLIRLTKEAALTALRSSGCWANGISLFFAALDWGQVDASEAPALLWIDMESGEEAKAYVQRVRKEAACHGLHCGGDRLAVRLDQLDPRILPQKAAWHLRGARQDWLCDDVEAVLSSAGFSRFSEVTIEAKLLRRGQPVWEFRGLRQDFRDFVPIELEAAEGDIEGDMVLEAARVQRRRKTGDAKVLPLERVAKFGSVDVAELVKKVAAPKRRSRFARSKDAAATTPLEDMDVDGEAVDDGTEVGQKRRQAEQGGGKGDSESSEPASKRVSKSVVLPEGAVAHSNDGGGDCLFHCLADVLSSVTKKRRGHRAVRASIAAWMESHVELLEPHWDHIAPDGSVATGSFVDYCKKIREAGSWAGWLELYAAGVAQDLNILLLCPEHTVKFPARNEQGHFAVFKYEGGHYEVVTMPEATIAQLWLAAETAKPAGGRGGGARSKASSLHLSEFGDDCSADAPVCTSSRRAASSLHLSAFSNHDSLPAVSTGGNQDGLALSEFASEGGTVNQGVRSRSCRSWPTPADLRSLSTAACERPVVLPPRRRLRSKSKQWLPLSALASESAGVAVSCEIQEPGSPVDEAPPQPQVPRPRKSKYRVDDVARWPCPLCPMVIESKSVSLLCKLRYSHCHRHHEGQGLPGARRVCLDAFRALGPEEPDDWRCPLCDWGLPQGTRGQITQAALATAKDQHRQAKHPGVSRKEYDGKLKVRGQRKAVHVMNVRVRRLNAFAAKRQRDGVASFVGWKSFTWPFVRNSKSKERRALCLKQAWCCVHCGFCTRVAVCRKSHVKLCSTWDRSKLVGQRARLWKSYAEAKKLEHGCRPGDVASGL